MIRVRINDLRIILLASRPAAESYEGPRHRGAKKASMSLEQEEDAHGDERSECQEQFAPCEAGSITIPVNEHTTFSCQCNPSTNPPTSSIHPFVPWIGQNDPRFDPECAFSRPGRNESGAARDGVLWTLTERQKSLTRRPLAQSPRYPSVARSTMSTSQRQGSQRR